ncbi:glycosyltransferase family 4 protein [Alistipes timonensis]|uniref:glycosyltransferase family 4 protein n=1 Tax=Alistipes timonensis TaxID=1465754 RepID=UPI001C3D97D8|nr:glycosyltransferase family 4 protein [Alistipes timonensis]MCR2029528.1 glycosyltransferase family 4 protein [Alistipes timonensis]
MKLFLISNMYPSLMHPGYGVFVKNVTDALPSYGADIRYRAVIEGRGAGRLAKIRKYLLLYFRIMIYYFRRYDAIYVHFPNQVAPLLLLLRLIQRKRMILNYHGEDLLYKPCGLSGLLGRCSDRLIPRADLIVVPSDYFRTILQDRHLCKSDKIVVSPSGGIDCNIFHHSISKIQDKMFHIGYVGRLESDKGVFELLDSLKQIEKTLNYQATFIGYGPAESALRERIKVFELQSRIQLKNGVPQTELHRFYSNFDLLIFPSKYCESLGLVGIEAMACGTPVVGSDIGGISSYLKDGYNGFLVPPGNADAISDAIVRYVQMPETERSLMVQNALYTAQRFSRESVVGELADKMKQIIA